MYVTEVKKVEDCFDGSSVFRYWFDQPWTPETINRLEALGKLDYFADFPRPFFRLSATSGLQVKGVEGEDSCQVVLPREGREPAREELARLFSPGKHDSVVS